VDSSTFYKHITPTLPEPLRARHLLVFCAKRALDAAIATPPLNRAKGKEKSKDEVRTQEGDRLVKEIMEEFLANLGKGGIDTNVFAPGVSALSTESRDVADETRALYPLDFQCDHIRGMFRVERSSPARKLSSNGKHIELRTEVQLDASTGVSRKTRNGRP